RERGHGGGPRRSGPCRARALGFDYLSTEEVARLPAAQIVDRLLAAKQQPVAQTEAAASATLGTVAPPQIMLSGLFGEFEKLSKASLKDLSPDQKRKWRNPKLRAATNLLGVIGDMPVASVNRGHALDFRQWWEDRALTGSVEIETANKDFGHLNMMFKAIERSHRIGLGPVFGELRINGGSTGQRLAFDPTFVQDKLLATGALAALNPEARAVVYLIAETGLRLSEAVNLTEETIDLTATVPHVRVRPDGRRMKTEQSERDMPLVGVALMAMQAFPGGFPRYRDKSASLSATVNKFLAKAKLLPATGQTLYSLRHTFEDRLTAVEVPEKLAAALMGHKFHRPRYGLGPSLAQKQEWLQRIAFRPPSTV
ncbi:site-specific integrase, partial [Methylobacterium jeotgali]|uniref:site-specific integrase n=1 Tax=Methylobacterium jeotgali TaxID=381630 RepID=UPI002795A595